MSGKSVSRALRAHFLVESALVNKLMILLIDISDSKDEDNETSVDDNELGDHEVIKHGSIHIDDLKAEFESITKKLENDSSFSVETYPTLAKLQDHLEDYKDVLKGSSRTPMLWLQYLGYVDVFFGFEFRVISLLDKFHG